MKFRGFYRISQFIPSQVIPLFSLNEKTYCQESADGEIIDSFIEVFDFNKERVFVTDENKVRIPRIGEPALYAYEYKKGSVTIGTLSNVKKRVESMLTQDSFFKDSEFARLEAAFFTENSQLVKIAAVQCFKKLNRRSENISRKWLEGSLLDDQIKDWVVSNFSINPNTVKLRSVGFRVSALRLLINIIDDFARKKSIDRNVFITLCVRNTAMILSNEIRRQFIETHNFHLIDETINNIHYWSDELGAIKWRKGLRFIVNKFNFDNNLSSASYAHELIEMDEFSAHGLYYSRPSIKLGQAEMEIMRDVLIRTTGQTERARFAFLLFCIKTSEPNFISSLSDVKNKLQFGDYSSEKLHKYHKKYGDLIFSKI